ncbi:MAG: hypothetical protein JWO32_2544 [Bacteroidetes bacterium]|nr:hypothetical protein [Bacteroidota bacterium]
MKLILLSIITLLFSAFSSKAQAYKAMPTDSATWGLQYVTQFNTTYNKEIVKGDTLLAGKTYHKTYSHTGALLGFYRELNKKVYAKVLNHPDTSEILLYDFNLNVGDTFYDKRTSPSQITFYYKYKVTSISTSTVTIDACKQYYFSCVGYQGPPSSYSNVGAACSLSWIEGIGSVQGLFNTRANGEGLECFLAALSSGGTAYLICFEHNSIQYMTQSCLTVGLNESGISSGLFQQFKIYPNPTTGFFYINAKCVSANMIYTIKLLNVLGQEVYFTKNEYGIDITGLKTGVYFLQVYVQDKLFQTTKLIKE